MKKLRKINKVVAFILALTLVLGMTTVAFAEPEVPEVTYKDWSPVTINKDLTINNQGTVNPAETFDFVIGGGTVTDGAALAAPAFDPNTFTITVAQAGTTGSADITLPTFTKVGVYTYPVTETAGNTAGMDYDGGTYYLVVTVINNPDFGEQGEPEFLRVLTLTDANDVKDDSFNNDFDAGDLEINKVTTGNYTDPDDEFTVTVTLTPQSGKVLVDDAIVAAGNDSYNQNATTGVVTIVYKVKGGDTYTIKNIPYDVNYAVVETQDPDYDAPAYDDKANGAMDAALISTTITNNRNTDIDTGINLDNLPYITIIVLALGGLVGFTVRKRRINE